MICDEFPFCYCPCKLCGVRNRKCPIRLTTKVADEFQLLFSVFKGTQYTNLRRPRSIQPRSQ